MSDFRDLSVIKQNLPVIDFDKSVNSNELESFQNIVVRPILKFQNELLNSIVLERVTTLHKKFLTLSDEEQISLILTNVKKDTALRNQLIGVVLAFFTTDEFQTYSKFNKELNKRFVEMIAQRVIDQYKKFVLFK